MTRTSHTGSEVASPSSNRMTEDEFRSLYRRLRDTVSWGADDRRGALNQLTPAETLLAATREVRLGRTISLASPVDLQPSADNAEPAEHLMTASPAQTPGPGLAFSRDRIAMNIHGDVDSHIDALCHVAFDGELYNGVPAKTVTEGGATELSIGTAADGIVGRGVLLDIPRQRGVPWLEPGDHVTVDDLLAAERHQGVRAGRGDILLIRVGHKARRKDRGAWDASASRAGLHPEVIVALGERQVAVLGTDGNGDTAPSLVTGVDYPVHVLAVQALGLMLMDYLQFEDLAPACAQSNRWSFLCVIAPLRLGAGTGSPVNPIAVL
jgi:kynurenine formamidase